MRHFLVYGTDESGEPIRGNETPLFIMSFKKAEIPEDFLPMRAFLRDRAFDRIGHNFTHAKEVTVSGLDAMVTRLEKKADTMEDFLIYARDAEIKA